MVNQLEADERRCLGRWVQGRDHPDVRQRSLHAVHLLLGQIGVGREADEVVDVERVAALAEPELGRLHLVDDPGELRREVAELVKVHALYDVRGPTPAHGNDSHATMNKLVTRYVQALLPGLVQKAGLHGHEAEQVAVGLGEGVLVKATLHVASRHV